MPFWVCRKTSGLMACLMRFWMQDFFKTQSKIELKEYGFPPQNHSPRGVYSRIHLQLHFILFRKGRVWSEGWEAVNRRADLRPLRNDKSPTGKRDSFFARWASGTSQFSPSACSTNLRRRNLRRWRSSTKWGHARKIGWGD